MTSSRAHSVSILAIDPGKSGGFAMLHSDGVTNNWGMPATEKDIFDMIRTLRPSRAVIEKVWGMPGQGGSASFNFGHNYGGLRMALIALGIPFESVPATKWQKGLGLPTLKKAGSKTAKKNFHKARAQELFPALTITHKTADALLIGYSALRTMV